MSEFTTIARPYALAAFSFAVANKNVVHWQNMLLLATEVTKNKQISAIISDKITLSPKLVTALIVDICGKQLDLHGRNFIQIMAENNRLNVLSDVLKQFIRLRAESESIKEVEVISVNSLHKEQLLKISMAMERRLLHKVKLNCRIDKHIIAGVIIRFNDTIIDGSLRGRLERFSSFLQF